MGKWSNLATAVAAVIRANGNHEITGQVLQNVLLNIISNLGNFASFAGMATPSTNPGTPDGPVYYFATQAGTYTNFGALVLDGSCYILYWNGMVWSSTKIGLPTTAEVTSAMNSLITAESAARQQADTSLQSAIAAEATRATGKEQELESAIYETEDRLIETRENAASSLPIFPTDGSVNNIVQGHTYKYSVSFGKVHTGLFRVTLIDPDKVEIATVYSNNSYTSSTSQPFEVTFVAPVSAPRIKCQFASYGESTLTLSLTEVVKVNKIEEVQTDVTAINASVADLYTKVGFTETDYVETDSILNTTSGYPSFPIYRPLYSNKQYKLKVVFRKAHTGFFKVDIKNSTTEHTFTLEAGNKTVTAGQEITIDIVWPAEPDELYDKLSCVFSGFGKGMDWYIYTPKDVVREDAETAIRAVADDKPVRFILITDMHYNSPQARNKTEQEDTRRDGLTENERCQWWINLIKEEQKKRRIDFVLSTGDTLLCDSEVSHPVRYTPSVFRNQFLRQLNIPFYATTGNHDMDYTEEEWLNCFGHSKEFSFECGNLYVICPDFCANQERFPGGAWKPDTFAAHEAFMNAELAKAKARGMIVAIASHLSEKPSQGQGDDWGYELVYDWMKQNDVHIYICGHQHVYENLLVNMGDGFRIWRICAGWFAYRNPAGYGDNRTPWGYDIFEIADNRIRRIHVIPEWYYKDTYDYLVEHGITPHLGVDGYVQASVVEFDSHLIDIVNKAGAIYAVSANMGEYNVAEEFIAVPPMIPVPE